MLQLRIAVLTGQLFLLASCDAPWHAARSAADTQCKYRPYHKTAGGAAELLLLLRARSRITMHVAAASHTG